MIYDRLYHFPQEQSSSWIVEKNHYLHLSPFLFTKWKIADKRARERSRLETESFTQGSTTN